MNATHRHPYRAILGPIRIHKTFIITSTEQPLKGQAHEKRISTKAMWTLVLISQIARFLLGYFFKSFLFRYYLDLQ